MKVGFTGTRDGMTDEQKRAFAGWLLAHPTVAEFHHGCCVGADATAARMVAEANAFGVAAIHAHLSDLPGAFTDHEARRVSSVEHRAKPPLDRNRDIVNACDVLVACPKGPEEQRSGTWATIRFARRQGKPIVIIWRDGTVTQEGGKPVVICWPDGKIEG